MSQHIDLKDAIVRLVEDSSLTDEVMDDTAQLLIEWGISKLRLIVPQAPNTLVFEARFRQLRLLIRSINRFTAHRETLDSDEQRDYVRAVLDAARQLGFSAPYGRVGDFVEQLQVLDENAMVRALLALVDTGDTGIHGSAPPFLR